QQHLRRRLFSIVVAVSSCIYALVSFSPVSVVVFSSSSVVVSFSISISDRRFLLSSPSSSSSFLASPSSTPIGVASSPIAVERLLSQRRLLLSPSLSRRRLIVSSSPLPALSPIVSVSSPIHSSLEASDCGHLLFLGSFISLLHSPCKATTILGQLFAAIAGFQQHCYSTQRRQLIIPNFLRRSVRPSASPWATITDPRAGGHLKLSSLGKDAIALQGNFGEVTKREKAAAEPSEPIFFRLESVGI
ncbi:hypothetical protein ACLOJK_028995, partial [Asimina triloba]